MKYENIYTNIFFGILLAITTMVSMGLTSIIGNWMEIEYQFIQLFLPVVVTFFIVQVITEFVFGLFARANQLSTKTGSKNSSNIKNGNSNESDNSKDPSDDDDFPGTAL